MQFLIVSTLIFSFISLILAASFIDDSSSCVADCPEPSSGGIKCHEKRQLVLTPRTCYKCPEYKCVKNKYLKTGGAKFCTKHIPQCGDDCPSYKTCFVSVKTAWSCPKAKCVSKMGNASRVVDYVL